MNKNDVINAFNRTYSFKHIPIHVLLWTALQKKREKRIKELWISTAIKHTLFYFNKLFLTTLIFINQPNIFLSAKIPIIAKQIFVYWVIPRSFQQIFEFTFAPCWYDTILFVRRDSLIISKREETSMTRLPRWITRPHSLCNVIYPSTYKSERRRWPGGAF